MEYSHTFNVFCLQVTRLEERESDMKKEYNALHQRHTEVRPAHLYPCVIFLYLEELDLYLVCLIGPSGHTSLLLCCVTDDSNIRGAHRAVQNAAGGEQQPTRGPRLWTNVSDFFSAYRITPVFLDPLFLCCFVLNVADS